MGWRGCPGRTLLKVHCKDRIIILVQVTDTKAVPVPSDGFPSPVNGRAGGFGAGGGVFRGSGAGMSSCKRGWVWAGLKTGGDQFATVKSLKRSIGIS